MNLLDSVILGVVEGITEFLPISSTGHMILTSHLLGAEGEVVKTFEIFIQLGAILAVVFLYHHRFKMLFQAGTPNAFAGKRGWLLLAITSLPILAVGFLTKDIIKGQLFGPTTVAWALGIGGIALIVVEQLRLKSSTETLDDISLRQAFFIGILQCLALWPGMSRAGSTIIGGLFAGLNRSTAAEYSFIAAVPVMCIVTTYELLKALGELKASDLLLFAVGFGVAFISAIFAIKGFIHLLKRTTLTPFGIYRIAIAALFLWVVL